MLEKVDWIIEERRKIAEQYFKKLDGIDCIRLPYEEAGSFSNFQSLSVYLKRNAKITRNNLIEKLLECGISTRRGVMIAHREIAHSRRTNGTILSVSEDASGRSIQLPLYVGLDESEVSYITDKIKELLT